MRFQNLVLAFGVLVHSQSTPPEQCATGVHAILIRGQGPGDHLNVMVTIQNLVLQLIPGSTSIALPYKHGADDHRIAAGNGAYLMQEYIREYIADCPNSKIFLHGYSLVSPHSMVGHIPFQICFSIHSFSNRVLLLEGLCGYYRFPRALANKSPKNGHATNVSRLDSSPRWRYEIQLKHEIFTGRNCPDGRSMWNQFVLALPRASLGAKV
ncbi:hypothetical protein N7481_009012 [Penicillium waksmanii]|uniref:uncharacterized protein n=1 Tax=Penicillium waksmanii TaxID=69791 RepID=UPI0025492616|nr:uncharacterized protein N7481_009012 [Penicillium waksmanii]KAJ5975305.1 hypothetical protein N7481_009012 [Penicillium waksmanii]